MNKTKTLKFNIEIFIYIDNLFKQLGTNRNIRIRKSIRFLINDYKFLNRFTRFNYVQLSFNYND